MATYYVRKTGSNSNNGTSPSTAWLTLGKVLGSGSTVVAGDTIYVGAGNYHELITVAVSGSSGNPITLIADVVGQQTGDIGPVIWSNWMGASGFDSPPSGSGGISLQPNAKTDFVLTGFTFIGGGTASNLGELVTATSASKRWTFNDCYFYCGRTANNNGQGLRIESDPTIGNGSFEWRFNRCIFTGGNQCFCMVSWTSATGVGNADWDWDLEFADCLFYFTGFENAPIGSNTFRGGGARFYRCTGIGATMVFLNGAAAGSTTFPCQARNCIYWSWVGGYFVAAGAAGQLVEDYNLLFSANPRLNVTAGANSRASANALHLPSLGIPISILLGKDAAQMGGEPLAWATQLLARDFWGVGHD